MLVAKLIGCKRRDVTRHVKRDDCFIDTTQIQVLHENHIIFLIMDINVSDEVHSSRITAGNHWVEGLSIPYSHTGHGSIQGDKWYVLETMSLIEWHSRVERSILAELKICNKGGLRIFSHVTFCACPQGFSSCHVNLWPFP